MAEQEDYGVVYLLTNSAMPGLVKIGWTRRTEVSKRMAELYNPSGIPLPFQLEFACRVKKEDCAKVEKALHVAFKEKRVNPSREFFAIDIEQARGILRCIHIEEEEDITTEIDAAMQKDLTESDKNAITEFERKRRPLNFDEMGIPRDSKLVYSKDETIEVEVCEAKKVLHNGEKKSLTAVTKELLGLDYSVQPTPYWTYNGKKLSDLYEETYLRCEE